MVTQIQNPKTPLRDMLAACKSNQLLTPPEFMARLEKIANYAASHMGEVSELDNAHLHLLHTVMTLVDKIKETTDLMPG